MGIVKHVLLDSGPLGLFIHPRSKPYVLKMRQWVSDMHAAGHRIYLPGIIDYEVRRELNRLPGMIALTRLNAARGGLEFLEVGTHTLDLAAENWAALRRAGLPTSGPTDVDVDSILAAQAMLSNEPNVIVASSNAGHLSRLVAAEDWPLILP